MASAREVCGNAREVQGVSRADYEWQVEWTLNNLNTQGWSGGWIVQAIADLGQGAIYLSPLCQRGIPWIYFLGFYEAWEVDSTGRICPGLCGDPCQNFDGHPVDDWLFRANMQCINGSFTFSGAAKLFSKEQVGTTGPDTWGSSGCLPTTGATPLWFSNLP